MNGGLSNGGFSVNANAFAGEVFAPSVASGMKKPDNTTGGRLDAGQVWTLAQVALRAGERQILGLVAASMLARDDMLEVKSQLGNGLRQSAVVAAVASAAANQLPQIGVH
jgi:hypothetical protein